MAQVGRGAHRLHGLGHAARRRSRRSPRPLFDYFTQLFAQVTNPPLDAIREELVTSTRVTIGGEDNLLTESPTEHCHQIVLPSPVLSIDELAKIRYIDEFDADRRVSRRSSSTDSSTRQRTAGSGASASPRRIDALCDEVVGDVRAGANIIILSDRNTTPELRRRSPACSLASARPPPTRRRAPAHERAPDHRVRRRARGPPRRAAARLRGVRGLPVPGLRVDRRAGRRGRARRARAPSRRATSTARH